MEWKPKAASTKLSDDADVTWVSEDFNVSQLLKRRGKDIPWQRKIHHPVNCLWTWPRLNKLHHTDHHDDHADHGHGHGEHRKGSDDDEDEDDDADNIGTSFDTVAEHGEHHEEHELEEHWLELFLELVLVGLFSNLCHTFVSGSYSFATFRISWIFFSTVASSILQLTLLVNLLVIVDMYSLFSLMMLSIGALLMSASIEVREHEPCESFATDDPDAMGWFEDGLVLSCIGQLLMQLPAAVLIQEARGYMLMFSFSNIFTLVSVIFTPFSNESFEAFKGVHWQVNVVSNVVFMLAVLTSKMPNHMTTRHWYARLDVMVLVAMGEWILRLIISEHGDYRPVRIVVCEVITSLLLGLTYFNCRVSDLQLNLEFFRGRLLLLGDTYLQYVLCISFFLNAVDVDLHVYHKRYVDEDIGRRLSGHGNEIHKCLHGEIFWSKFIIRWMKAVNFTFSRSLLLINRQLRYIRSNPKEPWFPPKLIFRLLLIGCHMLVIPTARLFATTVLQRDSSLPTEHIIYSGSTQFLHLLILSVDTFLLEMNAGSMVQESTNRLKMSWARRAQSMKKRATARLKSISVAKRLTVSPEEAARVILRDFMEKCSSVPLPLIADPITSFWKMPALRKKEELDDEDEPVDSHAHEHLQTHWLEQFNDLILVATLSNVCHLLLQTELTWDALTQKFQLLAYMLHALRSVTHYINLFEVDNLMVVVNMVAVTCGTALMAIAAHPGAHGLCLAEFWDNPSNARKFEIGILVTALAQLSLRLPAAIFEGRSRSYMLVLCSSNLFQVTHSIVDHLGMAGRGFRIGGKYWAHNTTHSVVLGFCLLFTPMGSHFNMDHWYHRLDILILVSLGEWLLQLVLSPRIDYPLSDLFVEVLSCLAIAAQYFSSREHGVYPNTKTIQGRFLIFIDTGLQCLLMFCLFMNAADVAFWAHLLEHQREHSHHGEEEECHDGRQALKLDADVLRWWKVKSLFIGRLLLLLIRHSRKIRSNPDEGIVPGNKFLLRIALVCCHWLVVPLSHVFEQADPHSKMGCTNIMHCVLAVIDLLCFEIGIHKKLHQMNFEVLASLDASRHHDHGSPSGRHGHSSSSCRELRSHKSSGESCVELACIETSEPDQQKAKEDILCRDEKRGEADNQTVESW